MSRRKRYRRRSRQADGAFQAINITPFTDVLLVLLIIFLIAGSSLAPTGLEVDELATEAVTGESGAEEIDESTLFVHPNGEVTRIRGTEVSRNVELESLERGTPVNLTAGPDTRVEVVIRVYDRLLLLGFTSVRLASPQQDRFQ